MRQPKSNKQSNEEARKFRRPTTQRTKWVEAGDGAGPEASDTEEFQLFAIGEKSSCPIQADLLVNGKPLCMEIDTGAAVSIISASKLKELLPQATLRKSQVILKTYTGERMAVVGELTVDVQHGQQSKALVLIVVAGDGPSLLGRNWLQDLRLDWKRIGAIAVNSNRHTLESLLSTHADIFKDELGTIQSFKAKLQVRPAAQPKFLKP